ncbi:MAG: hypothetical protein K8H89_14680 [Flavobacteriales bacterium]|nr:hypothetical protein [Flavobacteriales bacterium]
MNPDPLTDDQLLDGYAKGMLTREQEVQYYQRILGMSKDNAEELASTDQAQDIRNAEAGSGPIL